MFLATMRRIMNPIATGSCFSPFLNNYKRYKYKFPTRSTTKMFLILLRALSLSAPVLSYARNCKELQNNGVSWTGIYTIKPDSSPKPFFAYCDMETQNGGWVYVLNRFNGLERFARPWVDYKYGFGSPAREYWLGLEHLHALTYPDACELLIELVDWNMHKYFAHYKAFSIDSEDRYYRLHVVGGYSGNCGDSLSPHSGMKFSTPDRDNDEVPNESCLRVYGKGGWWYKDCFASQLTGLYLVNEQAIMGNFTGINWQENKINNLPNFYSYKEARMMIRPQTNRGLHYY